jgi:hypothetical protein
VNTPRVSVLMAVFNGGSWLDESIRSIAAQTFRDWELIVVDDASTDGTREVIEAWSRRDPRVRLVANPTNKGQTACLNQGLSVCRGPWIARQDADDISAPRRLAEQMDYLEAHPDTMLLGTQGVLIDDAGRRVGLLDVPADGAGVLWWSAFLNPFLHTSVVFRRENVMGEFGGYDTNFRIAQDYDLWTRVAARYPTANVAERLVSYRRTGTSLSRAGAEAAYAETDTVSAREARRVFGRPWSAEEEALSGQFRRGLSAVQRSSFLRMIKRLAAEFRARYPHAAAAPENAQPAWHLRLAGSAGSVSAAAGEMWRAMWHDPAFTLRWCKDRWL